MSIALFPDFAGAIPENEYAATRVNPDGTKTTRFLAAGGAKLYRMEDGVLKRPFEGASWSVDQDTGKIRLDMLGHYLELYPFIYTPSLSDPVTLWSDLTSQQKVAINPVLTFGSEDDLRNLKFGLDFSYYPNAGMAGIGFLLWDTDVEYETYVARDPRGDIVDVGLDLPNNWRFSFSDIVESGYTLTPFTGRRRPGVLVTGFPLEPGVRINLDPTTVVYGAATDRDLKEIPAGTISYGAVASSIYLYPYKVQSPYEQWRSFLLFNTGAVIPAGATVLSAKLYFQKLSILVGTPAYFQSPFRLDVYLSKDMDGFGDTIDATLADWNSMGFYLDQQFTTTNNLKENILLNVNPANIATADDIGGGWLGYTNVKLVEATWTYPSWDYIYWTILSADNPPTKAPYIEVTYSTGAGRPVNQFNRVDGLPQRL